jgi:hypothetical protein
MTNPTAVSRQVAHRLEPGVHHLNNQVLRDVYGLSRVTARARTDIADDLERVGLEVLSDPAVEPLTVRKTAVQRAAVRPPKPADKVWWKRPWAIAVGAVVLLLMVAGALGDSQTTPAAPEDAQAVAETTPAETAPAEPAATLADAEEAVEDGDFSEALAIAAAFSGDDRDRIRRKISRTLAREVRVALRAGDRWAAKDALRRSGRYGTTPEIRAARASYRTAKARAAERAAARRVAREAARQRAAERRAAREAEEAAAAAASGPAYEDSYDAPEAEMSGPSTTNWCGKRDGDGDGIYCE